MEKVKVVYMDGKETEYDVDYTKAYIAKIIESQNALTLDRKTVREIYASGELVAVFADGFSNELVYNKFRSKKTTNAFYDACVDRQKPTAGMGRYKGHTVPKYIDDHLKLISEQDLKDKIKAEEDWNEYQALMNHAQEMLEENAWVMDHTGGNVKINYIPMSL
jgi:hypothetical protein